MRCEISVLNLKSYQNKNFFFTKQTQLKRSRFFENRNQLEPTSSKELAPEFFPSEFREEKWDTF